MVRFSFWFGTVLVVFHAAISTYTAYTSKDLAMTLDLVNSVSTINFNIALGYGAIAIAFGTYLSRNVQKNYKKEFKDLLISIYLFIFLNTGVYLLTAIQTFLPKNFILLMFSFVLISFFIINFFIMQLTFKVFE